MQRGCRVKCVKDADVCMKAIKKTVNGIQSSNDGMSLDKGPQRACLHGGGGPQVGEVTRLGGVTRLSI